MQIQAFRISGKAFEKDAKHLIALINMLRVPLNGQLRISNYGKGLHSIGLIFVVSDLDVNFHPNYADFNKSKKQLLIQVRLPKQLLDPPLLAHAYLEALEEIERHDQIPDFDFPAFRRDVSQLFEAQGWLVKEAA